jgi:ABC-type transport system involved in multi-copper enzyme maturation permease subunit
MKFLAILKDSVREAIDSKVFYFMIGLSTLIILFIASISYQPVSVELDLTRMMDMLTLGMRGQLKGMAAPSVRIEDFRQTNETPADEPWRADFRFNVVWEFPKEMQPTQLPKEVRTQLVSQTDRLIRQLFSYLNEITVSEGQSPDPQSVVVTVNTRGTTVADRRGWLHQPRILFAIPVTILRMPLGEMVGLIENTLVNTIGAGIALLISTIITAFFIPNMLRKGTVDMLLVKPMHRTTLLLYKFIGGLAFMFMNTVFTVAGIWLVVGLRSGLWSWGFLLSIIIITYQFAVYYSISTFFAVLTRSPIVAILMTCLAWFIFFLIGTGYNIIDATRVAMDPANAHLLGVPDDQRPLQKPFPEWVYTTADALHYATPRMKDLDGLSALWVAQDLLPSHNLSRKQAEIVYHSFKWGEAFSVTTVYMAVFLGLSCLWFATRDY